LAYADIGIEILNHAYNIALHVAIYFIIIAAFNNTTVPEDTKKV